MEPATLAEVAGRLISWATDQTNALEMRMRRIERKIDLGQLAALRAGLDTVGRASSSSGQLEIAVQRLEEVAQYAQGCVNTAAETLYDASWTGAAKGAVQGLLSWASFGTFARDPEAGALEDYLEVLSWEVVWAHALLGAALAYERLKQVDAMEAALKAAHARLLREYPNSYEVHKVLAVLQRVQGYGIRAKDVFQYMRHLNRYEEELMELTKDFSWDDPDEKTADWISVAVHVLEELEELAEASRRYTLLLKEEHPMVWQEFNREP